MSARKPTAAEAWVWYDWYLAWCAMRRERDEREASADVYNDRIRREREQQEQGHE